MKLYKYSDSYLSSEDSIDEAPAGVYVQVEDYLKLLEKYLDMGAQIVSLHDGLKDESLTFLRTLRAKTAK